MQTITAAINGFKSTLGKYSRKRVGNPAEIMKQLATLATVLPKGHMTHKALVEYCTDRQKIIENLSNAHIVAEMSKQYPLLDDGIFALRRVLQFKKDAIATDVVLEADEKSPATSSLADIEKTITTKLFAVAALQYGLESVLHRSTIDYYTAARGGWRQPRLQIRATIPELPDEMIAAGRRGLGNYLVAAGKTLVTGLAPEAAGSYSGNFEVLWIPTPESLKVAYLKPPARTRPDPALLLVVNKSRFVLGTWTISEEKPFEHILREFTTGPEKK